MWLTHDVTLSCMLFCHVMSAVSSLLSLSELSNLILLDSPKFFFRLIIRRSSPLCKNSRTHLYPESTTLITEIEATGVQLKTETYLAWSIALPCLKSKMFSGKSVQALFAIK